MEKLLIITGAGASHDVVETIRNSQTTITSLHSNIKYRPPLTEKLFDMTFSDHESACIKEVLHRNQMSYQAAYEYKMSGSELTLEKYLQGLRDSNTIEAQRRYWSIPIYLYELFSEICQNYLHSRNGVPSNYLALFNLFVKLGCKKVLWINLNYDLFADMAIKNAVAGEIRTIDDYANMKTRDNIDIMYVKPHGSLDWFIQIKGKTTRSKIVTGKVEDYSNFESILDNKIQLNPTYVHETEEVGRGHIQQHINTVCPNSAYPAIAVPVGRYKFVHDEQRIRLLPELKTASHLLCIGFSARDEDVLSLLKELPRIEKLLIVNGKHHANIKSKKEAFNNIISTCGCSKVMTSEEDAIYDGGFTDLIKNGMPGWFTDDMA